MKEEIREELKILGENLGKSTTTTKATIFSGFWLWLILIIDSEQGPDLLDALVQYIMALS